MDGVLVLLIATVLYLKYLPKKGSVQSEEQSQDEGVCIMLNPCLNPDRFHDEDAFMVVANELGFR